MIVDLDVIEERYAEATTAHKLEVLLDVDHTVYRHLRFARPGTGIYLIDVVTWPGHLMVGGDIDTWVFRRQHDMFEFFSGDDYSFSPDYWAEKLVAPRPSEAYVFSPEHFKDVVKREGVEVSGIPYDLEGAVSMLEAAGVTEAWDMGLTKLSHQFLFACVAIRDIIRRYEGLALPEGQAA